MRFRLATPRGMCMNVKRLACRYCNSVVFICFALAIALLLLVVSAPARIPSIVRVVSDFDVDFVDVRKNSLNTIFIEQADGSVFIAFQLKNSSKTVRRFTNDLILSHSAFAELKNPQRVAKEPDIANEPEAFKKPKSANASMATNETKVANVPKAAASEPKATKDVAIKHEVTTAVQNESIINNKTKTKATNTSVSGDRPQAQEKNPPPKPTFPITLRENPYRINNENICQGLKELSFVVLVHSSTDHFMRRSSLRETWANYRLFTKHSMRIVFLVGSPGKDSTQILIEHENSLHRDIIQGNFVDTYHNLTHKGVLGLRWVSKYCPQAKRVVKVDDDVFVNVFKLMDEFDGKLANMTRQIMCYVRPKSTSLIQRKSGKWKIDDNEFFNKTYYPFTYCNGFFVIITTDIITELYNAAFDTPFFWVDDVYLFGMLPDRVGNVTFKSVPNLNLNEVAAIKCFDSDKQCAFLVANAHSDGVMDKLWFRLLEQYKDLAKSYSMNELF